MPSASTEFMYSLLTMTLVGITLTFSFTSYVDLLMQVSEVNRLRAILNQVAAEATESLAALTEDNVTLIVVVRLPLKIGDRDYWIRFDNDSNKAWVEGAFGRESRTGEQEYRVYLPKKVYASGTFEGGYELAQLNCSLNGSVPQLILSRKE